MKFGRSRAARHDRGHDDGRQDEDDAETTVTVRRVTRGDLYVRVSTVGDAGERPFLLVPGIGVSSDYFERLAPVLNRFGPVHALDLPGFAGVPHPGKALTIRQYADLVGAVIDDLALNDPIVVGHSMGTQMVVDLAARRSDQVGDLLPSSRLWEIPGAAHSVMHAHADEVAKLSVSHAEVPIGADEGGDLQFYTGASDGDERDDYSASAADVITAFVARVRSTVAAIKGDDRALAEAKTDHAEVMKTAYDRRQAEKSAQPDPSDAE